MCGVGTAEGRDQRQGWGRGLTQHVQHLGLQHSPMRTIRHGASTPRAACASESSQVQVQAAGLGLSLRRALVWDVRSPRFHPQYQTNRCSGAHLSSSEDTEVEGSEVQCSG